MGTRIHANTPTKSSMVTEGSGSMKMTAVCSLHDVLHAVEFQIVAIVTEGKGAHL